MRFRAHKCPHSLFLLWLLWFVQSLLPMLLVPYFDATNNSLTSTSRWLAISFNCATEGWDLLLHHREMVCSVLPICSANQRLVLSCSARTTRKRFNASFFWLYLRLSRLGRSSKLDGSRCSIRSIFAINCSIFERKYTQ